MCEKEVEQVDLRESCKETNINGGGINWMDEAFQELISDLNKGTLDEHHADDQLFTTTTEHVSLDGCLNLAVCEELAPVESSSTYNRPERQKLRRPTEDLENISDKTLSEMSLRKLNKLLAGRPKEKVREIRHRRRCLKNREYANNSRRKKNQAKESLERSVARLQKELSRMSIELEKVEKERDLYKKQLEFVIQSRADNRNAAFEV